MPLEQESKYHESDRTTIEAGSFSVIQAETARINKYTQLYRIGRRHVLGDLARHAGILAQ